MFSAGHLPRALNQNPVRTGLKTSQKPITPSSAHEMIENFRHLPRATHGQLFVRWTRTASGSVSRTELHPPKTVRPADGKRPKSCPSSTNTQSCCENSESWPPGAKFAPVFDGSAQRAPTNMASVRPSRCGTHCLPRSNLSALRCPLGHVS